MYWKEEVKSQFDASVYQEQVEIMESVLDMDDIITAMKNVREAVGV